MSSDVHDRRRYPRFSIYCPIQYTAEGKRAMERAITLNMSEGGAFISTHNLIGTGTALSLRLLLQDAYISVAGRVVHAIKEDRSNLSNIGVEFINRTSEYINRFNKEIDAITIYQRQSSDRNGREVSLAEASLNWYLNSPVWI